MQNTPNHFLSVIPEPPTYELLKVVTLELENRFTSAYIPTFEAISRSLSYSTYLISNALYQAAIRYRNKKIDYKNIYSPNNTLIITFYGEFNYNDYDEHYITLVWQIIRSYLIIRHTPPQQDIDYQYSFNTYNDCNLLIIGCRLQKDDLLQLMDFEVRPLELARS